MDEIKKPTFGTVLRDQRRVLIVALCLSVAGFWIFGPMNDWDIAAFLAVGILMGLVNHVATEYSLLKMISSGAELTRGEIAASALVRLLFVAGAAAAVAVIFWSTGIVALIGLALFRLLTLVMTGIPLLKELSKA
ncbi:MAG: hypothetical protein WAK18_01400 [Nocardioidaceae bacterium]